MTKSRDESAPVCQTCGHSHVCRCFEEPIFADGFCSYCGCSPGEDCDVHECLAHPSAAPVETLPDASECKACGHTRDAHMPETLTSGDVPGILATCSVCLDAAFAERRRARASTLFTRSRHDFQSPTPEPVTPEPVCRECDGAEDEECWRFNDGVKCEIGIHDPRCNDYHPFAPTGEPEQVPDLELAWADLWRAHNGDERCIECSESVNRAVRAESEARLDASVREAIRSERSLLADVKARASAAEEQVRVLTEALEKLAEFEARQD